MLFANRVAYVALVGAALFACLAPGRAPAQNPTTGPVATLGVPQAVDRPPPDITRTVFIPAVPSLLEQERAPPGVMPAKAPDTRRTPLAVFWDNGLRFESDNDQFHLHLGGSAQIDSTWLIGPQSVFLLPNGDANGVGNSAATFLRRARFRADGDLFGMFDFIVEYDLANASNENSGDQPASFSNLTSSPSPANVWLQIRDVPVLGYMRVGYQNKTIGMAANTSQGNLPFLERPDVEDGIYAPFDGGYALGVSARNWIDSERLAWTIGIYRPATNVFGVTLNKYAYGTRVTGLPWYEDDGQSLMHAGLGFWAGQLPQDELRLRARPLLRNGPGFAVPVLVDTGQIPGATQYSIGPEFALVQGPLTVQAEWAGQFLEGAAANGQPQGVAFFHGGYAEVLWFLTGEHQEYNKRDGVFGRVVPLYDYHLKKGDPYRSFGAWQIGARFSYLNLNDKAIQGGQIYDWTFGLNWFLNPNVKFQANYIVEHRDGPTGTPVGWINGIGLRAAFDF
jgi:phosphate-selective porin OprO/OprP